MAESANPQHPVFYATAYQPERLQPLPVWARPSERGHREAQRLLSMSAHATDDQVYSLGADDGERVALYRLAVRYGRTVGPPQIGDETAAQFGMFHLAGHLAARVVLGAAAAGDQTAQDGALHEYALTVIESLWPGNMPTEPSPDSLRAASELRRHLADFYGGDGPTGMSELARVAAAVPDPPHSTFPAALHHLIRTVTADYSAAPGSGPVLRAAHAELADRALDVN